MKSLLEQLRDKFALISEVFAIGLAVDDGRMTAAQASDAIGQAGHRSDLRQLDRGARLTPALPEDDLVDAR